MKTKRFLFYYNFNQVFAASKYSKSLRENSNNPELLKIQIPTYFFKRGF
ncbi:MAG: hypothetical protein ACJA1V_000408 [Flavobacteriaceae bacterium]|jgi:hypothetical protein